MADSHHDPPVLLLQPLCHLHRFNRPSSSLALSSIVERPERLRAIYIGFASAIARLEAVSHRWEEQKGRDVLQDGDGLIKALEGLGLGGGGLGDSMGMGGGGTGEGHQGGMDKEWDARGRGQGIVPKVLIAAKPEKGMLRTSKAVRFVHEPEDDEASCTKRYLERLLSWIEGCEEKLRGGECEIPEGLPKNDLYLCPESLLAISGALSAVCQAVDIVISSSRPSLSLPASSLPSLSSKPNHISTLSTSHNSLLPPIPVTPPVGTPSDASDDQSSFLAPSETDSSSSATAISQPNRDASEEAKKEGGVRATSAFVAVRPPGHHCGEDNPMGFCFVNNVLVGAAHAHLQHNIDRIVILDIDLHHGNGTQEAAMRINADTYREELLLAAGKPPAAGEAKRGLKIFYSSIHDIYSFPCEDGDLDRVKDASVNLSSHGQYIENIHLTPYTTESEFYARCYPKYTQLLSKAKQFLEETDGTPERTMVFVSAGFDACEHEIQGMQRHGGKVPVSFYSRFAEDTASFARSHSQGRVVSVLEGGYGDRALTSAAMASVVGMGGIGGESLLYQEREGWWTVGNLAKLENLTKPKRSTRSTAKSSSNNATMPSAPSSSSPHALSFPLNPSSSSPSSFSSSPDAWLSRTSDILSTLESSLNLNLPSATFSSSASSSPAVVPAPSGRTLRDRSTIAKPEKLEVGGGGSSHASSPKTTAKKTAANGGAAKKKDSMSSSSPAAVPAPVRQTSARRRSEREGTPTPSSTSVPASSATSIPQPAAAPSSDTPSAASSPFIPPTSSASTIVPEPSPASTTSTTSVPSSSPQSPLAVPIFPQSLTAVPTLSSLHLPHPEPHIPFAQPASEAAVDGTVDPPVEKKKRIILKFARPGLDSFPTEMKFEEHVHEAVDKREEEEEVD